MIHRIDQLDRFENKTLNKGPNWTVFKENATKFKESYLEILITKYDELRITNIRGGFEGLRGLAADFNNFIWDNIDDKNEGWKDIRYQFRGVIEALDSIETFIFSIATEAYETKV